MSDHKHCPRCQEDWPADTNFFHSTAGNKDGLYHHYKACCAELRKPRRKAKAQQLPRLTTELAQFRWAHTAPPAAP